MVVKLTVPTFSKQKLTSANSSEQDCRNSLKEMGDLQAKLSDPHPKHKLGVCPVYHHTRMRAYDVTKLPVYSTEGSDHLIASGKDTGWTIVVGLLVILHQQLGMPISAPPLACEIGRSDTCQRPDSHASDERCVYSAILARYWPNPGRAKRSVPGMGSSMTPASRSLLLYVET